MYFIKRNKPQTFHYSSKSRFHVMVYDIIDTENNQDENIFAVLESLHQQLVVLKITENNKNKRHQIELRTTFRTTWCI